MKTSTSLRIVGLLSSCALMASLTGRADPRAEAHPSMTPRKPAQASEQSIQDKFRRPLANRPFNDHEQGFDIRLLGFARADPKTFTLDITQLRVKVLSDFKNTHFEGKKLTLSLIESKGPSYSEASNEISICITQGAPEHTVTLNNLDAQFHLKPDVKLAAVRLRLSLHSDKSLLHFDSPIGQLVPSL